MIGLVSGFQADFVFSLNDTEPPVVLETPEQQQSSTGVGELVVDITFADLTEIYVVDFERQLALEKSTVNFGAVKPVYVATNSFSASFSQEFSETCSWFLLGVDSGGVKEILIDNGSQTYSVSEETSVYLGVDADTWELCEISGDIGDVGFDVSVNFRKPFDEDAYIKGLKNYQSCSGDATHSCLIFDGEEIDLDHCRGTGEGQLGLPIGVCIAGAEAIENALAEKTKTDLESALGRIGELEKGTDEQLAKDVNSVISSLLALESNRNADLRQESDTFTSIILGVLMFVLVVGGYIYVNNSSQLEARASPYLKKVSETIESVKKKYAERKEESVYSPEPLTNSDLDSFVKESKPKDVGLVPYERNVEFWSDD